MSSSAAELAAPAWSAYAFGLALDGDFPAPGLDAARTPSPPGSPAVAVRLAPRAAIEAHWPRDGAERLSRVRTEDGEVVLTIDRHPEAGLLFTGAGYGRFHVDAAATRVRCAPEPGPDWRWQRYLVGQVLPAVAGLHGFELLHAAAVATEGRAVAIAGPSGAGKSTVLVHLLAAGAAFMADDVVALRAEGDRVVAHPGPGLAVLRPDAAVALAAPLGPQVGADGDEVAVAVAGTAAPLPLGAIAFLARTPESAGVQVEVLAPEDPRPVLAAAYDLARRDPERLLGQLDVAARVARQATLLRVRVGAGAGPDAVARAILEATAR